MKKMDKLSYEEISDELKEDAKRAGIDLKSFFDSYERQQNKIDEMFKQIKEVM